MLYSQVQVRTAGLCRDAIGHSTPVVAQEHIEPNNSGIRFLLASW